MKNFFHTTLFFLIIILTSCSQPSQKKDSYENLVINILGDSLTYGYDASNTYGNKQLEHPYPSRIAEELNCTVNNLGIGGSTLSTANTKVGPMCYRVTTLPDADINILFGGGNDYFKKAPLGKLDSKDTSTICGALNVISDWYINNADRTKIIFIGIPGVNLYPYTDINNTVVNLDVINACIKKIAELNGFTYLDLSHDFPFYNPLNYSSAELWNKMPNGKIDRTHWNQDFIDYILTPYLCKKISELIE